MNLNSPTNIPTLNASDRIDIIREIVKSFSESVDFKPASNINLGDLQHKLPKVDLPEKKELLLQLGSEQKLKCGVNLSFNYGSAGKEHELVIHLDSRDFEKASFGSQRGIFIFRLDAVNAKIEFVGICSPDKRDQSAQPVLDSTLERRLIQLLDVSLLDLRDSVRAKTEFKNLSQLVIPFLNSTSTKNDKYTPEELKILKSAILKLTEIPTTINLSHRLINQIMVPAAYNLK